ncbi:hypothetical protein V6N13_118064 [Hibiscus sabdariffa]
MREGMKGKSGMIKRRGEMVGLYKREGNMGRLGSAIQPPVKGITFWQGRGDLLGGSCSVGAGWLVEFRNSGGVVDKEGSHATPSPQGVKGKKFRKSQTIMIRCFSSKTLTTNELKSCQNIGLKLRRRRPSHASSLTFGRAMSSSTLTAPHCATESQHPIAPCCTAPLIVVQQR